MTTEKEILNMSISKKKKNLVTIERSFSVLLE